MSEPVETLVRYSQWCAVSHGHGMDPRASGEWVKYDDYLALQERVERCEADALRYRWLRERTGPRETFNLFKSHPPTNDEFDAAIDAALDKAIEP